jgi:hypothetical protein
MTPKRWSANANYCRFCRYWFSQQNRHTYYDRRGYRPCGTPGCHSYALYCYSFCIGCYIARYGYCRKGWLNHEQRLQRSFLQAYAMDVNHSITLPLYREYNLTDQSDRRSYYAALRSRYSIKVRTRNRMASANYPYPWELEEQHG